jgi:nitrogen regulatory protein P-II 1
MKEINAIIQPIRLGPVRDALSTAGVHGMTVSDARGFGSQGGSIDTYRGIEYRVEYVPKIRIEVVVPDSILDGVIEAIMGAARTGNVGDGKIWVRDVSAVYRIRTGERDEVALS